MNDFERVKGLGEGLPAPRPQARDAARAALVAHLEAPTPRPKPAPRRFLRGRNLALAGSLAAVAAALLIALGTGGGSGVRPEPASAADLDLLAEPAPRFAIAGGWQIIDTEASPEDGATRFHYERDPTGATADVEILWQAAPIEELGKRLEAEGFEAAGTQPTRTVDAIKWREMAVDVADKNETFFRQGIAQIFASSPDPGGQLQVAGFWRDEGWTFELRTRVESLDLLERLLERLEVLGPEEWLVALQPGGAEWLRQSFNGTVQKLENVRTERADGTVVLETRATAKTPEQLERLEFTAPFPVVYREGDSVRVEIARAPG